jgi:hypothetical protein
MAAVAVRIASTTISGWKPSPPPRAVADAVEVAPYLLNLKSALRVPPNGAVRVRVPQVPAHDFCVLKSYW